ncbi:MAG TPA: toxin-activating lysine-acyltransferase [Sphingomonas sp.]|nr:toxin-activating lysine-acyltransferase [Sphingomonas sp.]
MRRPAGRPGRNGRFTPKGKTSGRRSTKTGRSIIASVMPALIHQQFYIFRDGQQPVGLALWAKCSPEAARKVDHGIVEPQYRLSLEEWNSGDEIWLVDLIAPFATADNRHRELMMADLMSKPLAGKEFKFHRTDAATGARTVQTVSADAGEKLKEALAAAFDLANN